MSEQYLIWSNEHRMWWGPKSSGYTRDINRAGRYSREDAIRFSSGRDQEPNQPLPELPVREDDIKAILHPPWRCPNCGVGPDYNGAELTADSPTQ